MRSDEYAALKHEQIERIKQRDSFLNVTMGAIALDAAIAVQGPEQAVAWLVVPWISCILGWTYLMNDDKVSALAAHLRGISPSPSWEAGTKGLIPRPVRGIGDFLVFLLAFIFPTPVALVLYDYGRGDGAWSRGVVVLAIVECVAALALLVAYAFSAWTRQSVPGP